MQIRNSNNKYKLLLLMAFLFLLFSKNAYSQDKKSGLINMVYSSDAHYGLYRPQFRGDTAVNSHVVNAAMIRQINQIPMLHLPADGGVSAGHYVGPVDYMVQTGDICNRMEIPIQSAAASWAQFKIDYMDGLKLKGHNGKPAKLLLAPGNHDISNAIGYSKPMMPLTDPTALVKIYNLMLKPVKPMTNEAYDFEKDKINYSFNMEGIHVMFITLWPDSAERIWMEKDLDTVAPKTPVIIFTHDQPTCEAKHFTNPLPPHQMTAANQFQNLVAENYKEGFVAAKDDGATNIEQRGLVQFLKKHANIKAYFHGNSNWNEFYTYKGPDNDANLPVFRVDSPMKGKYSGKDETLLSFQLITIDPQKQEMTVRECLWNTTPGDAHQKTVVGKSATLSIRVN
jgi:hypothetical protein